MEISKEAKICYCGKCKITCNKYGKRSKCDVCGKKRLLGQLVQLSQNTILFMCSECLENHRKIMNAKDQKRLNECLRATLKGVSCGDKEKQT